MNFTAIADHAMLLISRKKQAIGMVRIEYIAHIGNPNRHAGPVLLRDRAQAMGCLKNSRPQGTDLQAHDRAIGHDVENSTESVGPVGLGKPPGKP